MSICSLDLNATFCLLDDDLVIYCPFVRLLTKAKVKCLAPMFCSLFLHPMIHSGTTVTILVEASVITTTYTIVDLWIDSWLLNIKLDISIESECLLLSDSLNFSVITVCNPDLDNSVQTLSSWWPKIWCPSSLSSFTHLKENILFISRISISIGIIIRIVVDICIVINFNSAMKKSVIKW